MKRIALVLTAFCFSYLAEAQTQEITKVLEFKNDAYDFGKIVQGKAVKYTVEVKNISSDSVAIENVQVGCGCTTPDYEKGKKFGPGQSIKIGLGFNGNAHGAFTKQATLFFTGQSQLQKVVTFKGETFEAAETPAPANNAIQQLKQ